MAAVVTLAAATNRDGTHGRAALSRASPRTRLQAGARNRDSADFGHRGGIIQLSRSSTAWLNKARAVPALPR